VKNLGSVARKLRKRSTLTECHLWRHIKNRQIDGFKFRRQQPMGRYIVDFINFEKKLIIEVDGGQHAVNASYDKERDRWLRSEGYEILRFWDNEVFDNLEGVLTRIRQHLLPPHLNPLPQGERKHKLDRTGGNSSES
jgi:very-short-patch-repair endonuclease